MWQFDAEYSPSIERLASVIVITPHASAANVGSSLPHFGKEMTALQEFVGGGDDFTIPACLLAKGVHVELCLLRA